MNLTHTSMCSAFKQKRGYIDVLKIRFPFHARSTLVHFSRYSLLERGSAGRRRLLWPELKIRDVTSCINCVKVLTKETDIVWRKNRAIFCVPSQNFQTVSPHAQLHNLEIFHPWSLRASVSFYVEILHYSTVRFIRPFNLTYSYGVSNVEANLGTEIPCLRARGLTVEFFQPFPPPMRGFGYWNSTSKVARRKFFTKSANILLYKPNIRKRLIW